MEREVFDMFGFYFYNHPNMRSLLLDYGFKGNPLLKNYPLSGFSELYFLPDKQECVYLDIPK